MAKLVLTPQEIEDDEWEVVCDLPYAHCTHCGTQPELIDTEWVGNDTVHLCGNLVLDQDFCDGVHSGKDDLPWEPDFEDPSAIIVRVR